MVWDIGFWHLEMFDSWNIIIYQLIHLNTILLFGRYYRLNHFNIYFNIVLHFPKYWIKYDKKLYMVYELTKIYF